jgi:hypothetical protein
MKKLILTLAAIATTSFSFAQTADEIIDKHYAAIGGKDKWSKLTSTIQDAEMTVQGTMIKLKIYKEHNKLEKVEIEFNGMKGYQLMTDKEGWGYMPFQGQMKAEPATKDDVEQSKSELDVQGRLLNYKDKGSSVEYVGKEDLDGTDCFKLKLTEKGGKILNYYFDASSYLLLKQVSKVTINGKEMEQIEELGNYQKTPEGYLFPMSKTNNMQGSYKVTKIEVNTKIDPKVFEPTNK